MKLTLYEISLFFSAIHGIANFLLLIFSVHKFYGYVTAIEHKHVSLKQ